MGVFEQLEEIRSATPTEGGVGVVQLPKFTNPAPSVTVTANAPVVPTVTVPNEPAANLPITTNAPASQPPLPRRTVRPFGRSPVRRQLTRHSFELFQDQVEALRRLALEAKLAGEAGSMSEMAREALDAYLAQHTES